MKGTFKETMLKEIALQLSGAIPSLKEKLGEKKFEKRIKKAAKLLCEGIKPENRAKARTAKPPAKKTPEIKTKLPGEGIKISEQIKAPATKAPTVKPVVAKSKVASSPKKVAGKANANSK